MNNPLRIISNSIPWTSLVNLGIMIGTAYLISKYPAAASYLAAGGIGVAGVMPSPLLTKPPK